MTYKSIVDALEHQPNYRKEVVTVYGIAYSDCGYATFLNIGFDTEDEAFEYFIANNLAPQQLQVRAMTYNKYGGIDLGWENGTICYRKDVKYM